MAQVGSPQIEQTAQYVERQALLLQKLAQQTRPDLVVEVHTHIHQLILLKDLLLSASACKPRQIIAPAELARTSVLGCKTTEPFGCRGDCM